MAKKKSSSRLQKLIIILVILGICQVAFHLAFRREAPMTVQDAISANLDKKDNISARRKEQARIQLAIADYMAQNKGQSPQNLDQLVPKYFDSVPVDPETGKVFAYKIVKNRPIVGELVKARDTKQKDGDKTKKKDGKAEESVIDPIEIQKALIASLSEDDQKLAFVYDPAGKRDPFRPFDFSVKMEFDKSKTPLERFDIGALKYTAYLTGFEDGATGIVETQQGRGYSVRKGTKIGTEGGEVVEVLPEKLLILERHTDFTGTEHTKTLEMKLRVKSQDDWR